MKGLLGVYLVDLDLFKLASFVEHGGMDFSLDLLDLFRGQERLLVPVLCWGEDVYFVKIHILIMSKIPFFFLLFNDFRSLCCLSF